MIKWLIVVAGLLGIFIIDYLVITIKEKNDYFDCSGGCDHCGRDCPDRID